MHASLCRRGLPALAFTCTLALALAPPSLAGSWPAGGAPLAVTAPGTVDDWLSRIGSWLRAAVWPGEGFGAGAARPQYGCGMDPSGQNCGSGAGAVRPQYGCGMDPSGQTCGNGPPRVTTTGSLHRGDGRR